MKLMLLSSSGQSKMFRAGNPIDLSLRAAEQLRDWLLELFPFPSISGLLSSVSSPGCIYLKLEGGSSHSSNSLDLAGGFSYERWVRFDLLFFRYQNADLLHAGRRASPFYCRILAFTKGADTLLQRHRLQTCVSPGLHRSGSLYSVILLRPTKAVLSGSREQ